MDATIEIVNRLAAPKSVNALLYTPVTSGLSCRETRVYELTADASEDAVRRFAGEVLADPVSDEIHLGATPALPGAAYHLDIALKRGLLDLEREYLLTYLRNDPKAGLSPKSLRVVRRIYIYGADASPAPERIVKDVVNPVIHTWKIHHA